MEDTYSQERSRIRYWKIQSKALQEPEEEETRGRSGKQWMQVQEWRNRLRIKQIAGKKRLTGGVPSHLCRAVK